MPEPVTAPVPQLRRLFGVAVVLPLAALAAALFTQFRMDMPPCPWCVLQRVIFVAIAIVALPGVLLAQRTVQLVTALEIGLLAACGAAAALWQHFVAASSTSCAMTLADRIVRGLALDEIWPAGFTPLASCSEAAVRLLGVPYEFWSLALFVGLGALAVLLVRRLLAPGGRAFGR